MGRVLRVLRLADRVTMPWKNGGGVTHELLRSGEGAAGFGLRLSVAEVAADGPFSRFPGVDRVILMLHGGGFRLRRDDGHTVTIDRPHAPFAFVGEDAWDCALLDGPVVDFNVMTDRATRRAQVAVEGPGPVEATWVLVLADQAVEGLPVAAGELVEAEGGVTVTGAVVTVRVRAV